MLKQKRIFTFSYLMIWIIFIVFRFNDLGKIIWLTQFIFSEQILVEWFHLERLHSKFNKVYDQLHDSFLNNIDENTPQGKTTIINAMVDYESAKSSACIKLSTNIFNKLNPELTKKWDQIRNELGMD
jgi:hypothetical protein